MSNKGMWSYKQMWTLSDDRRTVRLQLPPLPVDDVSIPLDVFMDFDADAIDKTLDRLIVLRARMLPAPQRL